MNATTTELLAKHAATLAAGLSPNSTEALEIVDAIIARNTGFKSLVEMTEQCGDSYRPTCCVEYPEMLLIADAYDARQEARGDERRAYRYGTPAAAPAPAPAPVWNLANAKAAYSAALREAKRELKRSGAGRWVKPRGGRLLAITADGERTRDSDCDWITWRGRWRDVAELASNPTVTSVIIDSGVDAAENLEDMNAGNYETEFFQVTVWER